MAVQAPDWLTKRGGSLRQEPGGGSWFVLLNGQPQYRLIPAPVGGKHGCRVVQTVNGKQLSAGTEDKHFLPGAHIRLTPL